MSERSTHALAIVLLLGHLFLLSTDARSRGNRLERWTLRLVAPLGHGARATLGAADSFFEGFRLAGTLREENRELHRELAALRHKLARLQGVEEQLERLARSSSYTRLETGSSFVADVVYVDEASWLRTLVLYTGTETPRRNQPVITDRGLVGRVVVTAGRYAKVLLATDRSFSVSAMLVRTRQRGMARGDGAGRLALDHITRAADVRVGDALVTAGIDGVFPRGIPIGRVLSVLPGQDLFYRIEVRPEIDFESLDQVFVLIREALPSEVAAELDQDLGGGSDADR